MIGNAGHRVRSSDDGGGGRGEIGDGISTLQQEHDASTATGGSSTNYPSLAHRLSRLSISTNNPQQQGQQQGQQRGQDHRGPAPTHKVPRRTSLADAGTGVQHSRRNAVVTTRQNLPVTLAAPTKMDRYQQAMYRQHKDVRLRVGDQDNFLAAAIDIPDDFSAASTIFEDMDMDDILDYLLAARESGSSNAPFVHVTPRFNVEDVPCSNFYDLVVLERPGHPTSGMVWMSGAERMRIKAMGHGDASEHLLEPMQVMQLSLHGLLMGLDEGHSAGLLSLRDFMLQRSQLEFLRTGRFFGCFKELKAFTAWKHFTRYHAMHKMKCRLMKSTFFSERELVKCVLLISDTAYELLLQLKLFYFHGNGAMCVSEYLDKQIAQNQQMRSRMVSMVNQLGDCLKEQHDVFMASDRLAQREQEVMDHHPLRDQIRSGEASVAGMRSVHRLKDEFKDKLKRLFMLAQLCVDYSMAQVVEQFWKRFQQMILGAKHVYRSRREEEMYYWDLDSSLFDGQSKISRFVLENFNTSKLFDGPIPQQEQQQWQQPEDGESGGGDELTHEGKGTTTFLSKGVAMAGGESTGATAGVAGAPARKDEKGVPVSSTWQQRGSHLCVNINICLGKRVIEMQDFLSLNSIDQLKVMVLPGKSALFDQMHALCGDLGIFLDSVPRIQKHPLVFDSRFVIKLDPPDVDLELGDMSHPNSSNYFTNMIMHPIFNSHGGYDLAIASLRAVQQAYAEASGVDSYLFKLFEIVRKLWSLSSAHITKLTERSLALSKVRAHIEDPQSVEDIRRSYLRDKGRLGAFRAATVYVDQIEAVIESFQDIKHKLGFIASFRPIVQQIRIYRSIQKFILSMRIPISFNTRCSVFYDFLRKFEKSLELSDTAYLDEQVELMRRLSNFESIREHYDGEAEICERMFRMIEGFKSKEEEGGLSSTDQQVSQLLSNRALKSSMAISSERLFELFNDGRDNLAVTINKVKTMILGQINTIKMNALSRRFGLHERIDAISEEITKYQYSSQDKSATEISTFLNNTGKKVASLRLDVNHTIAAQHVLLEAHDIVGAAVPVLKESEVDHFLDMDRLEQVYSIRCLVWSCITNAESINRQLMSARLVHNSIAEWSATLLDICEKHEYLQAHIDNEEVLEQIGSLIDNLYPKIEITSCLSSSSLRPRHWKWLSVNAFYHCGLVFKFSGKDSEFISVVDVARRTPLNLGNMNRIAIAELINRCANYPHSLRAINSAYTFILLLI